MVPLNLFSNRVTENEKEQMGRNIAKYKPPTIGDLESFQDMLSTHSFKKLSSVILLDVILGFSLTCLGSHHFHQIVFGETC